ncbi:hypothetical protein GCM10009792_08090 [Microcella alkalica]
MSTAWGTESGATRRSGPRAAPARAEALSASGKFAPEATYTVDAPAGKVRADVCAETAYRSGPAIRFIDPGTGGGALAYRPKFCV